MKKVPSAPKSSHDVQRLLRNQAGSYNSKMIVFIGLMPVEFEPTTDTKEPEFMLVAQTLSGKLSVFPMGVRELMNLKLTVDTFIESNQDTTWMS